MGRKVLLYNSKHKINVFDLPRETVAVFKEYNVKRHYETKHNGYLKFSSEVKQSKLREFMSQLKTQQKMFSSALQQPSNIVTPSYSVSFLIAKKMKNVQMVNL